MQPFVVKAWWLEKSPKRPYGQNIFRVRTFKIDARFEV